MVVGGKLGDVMTKYVRSWEAEVVRRRTEGSVSERLLRDHYRHIQWLQHERLVHLLVMLFVALVLLVVFVITLISPGMMIGLLLLILIVLTGFYIHHYYFLENTVQRWYRLADQLTFALTEG